MWQRVQTLYFAIATLLIAALFWSDAARVAGPDGSVGHIQYISKTIYLVWIIILTVLQVLTLGGYKWRMRQFRMSVVSVIACLGFQAWLAVDFIRFHEAMVFSWTALFPAVAAILDVFGARNILIDEALVQSANRLRLPRKKKI